MIQVDLRLFGAFRELGNGTDLKLELPEGARLAEVRSALVTKIRENASGFRDATLVQDSAFSDEDEILTDSSLIRPGAKLCVLPPVCGG